MRTKSIESAPVYDCEYVGCIPRCLRVSFTVNAIILEAMLLGVAMTMRWTIFASLRWSGTITRRPNMFDAEVSEGQCVLLLTPIHAQPVAPFQRTG